MTRLIVFDLDGTLVDSRRDLADSANALLVASGATGLSEEAIGRMVGDGAATLVARAFAASGREPPAGALDQFLSIYDGRLLNHTRPYPKIANVLTALGAQADLAVLTNKPRQATLRVLAGLDLARHFPADRVVAGDGPFARKPDPTGLQHLMAVAGVTPAETVLVGDSVVDWRTARHAGTRVCLARYGFGFEGVPIEVLDARTPILDRPEQLLTML